MLFFEQLFRDCACPPSQKHRCTVPGACAYLNELERAAGTLGMLPPEQTRGRGGQLLKHTVLIIVYSLSMFIVSILSFIQLPCYVHFLIFVIVLKRVIFLVFCFSLGLIQLVI